MPEPQAYVSANRDREGALVVVFLRGGADGLSLVVPAEDDSYYRARPRLSVAKNDAVALDGFFRLHPRLRPLERSFKEGDLAILHGAGSEDTTRSHFEAQDFMEHGGLVGGGWLGRYLRYRPSPADGALSAVALSKVMPECLRGAPAVTVMQSITSFSIGKDHPSLGAELAKLYALETDQLGEAGRDTIRAMERIESLQVTQYSPAGGAQYGQDEFSRGLMQVAQLIKARVGLEAASVDLNGWDSHFTQGTLIEPLMDRLGQGLAAFHADMGTMMRRTTVVVMTEFGRRVRENASFGTDHGRGSVMFLMGGGIHGGRVLAEWKGLSDGFLEGPGDLPVTFNYRNVLAPVLARHGRVEDFGRIFPEFSVQPVELYA